MSVADRRESFFLSEIVASNFNALDYLILHDTQIISIIEAKIIIEIYVVTVRYL